jgi:hypothetical protein
MGVTGFFGLRIKKVGRTLVNYCSGFCRGKASPGVARWTEPPPVAVPITAEPWFTTAITKR